MYSVKYVFLNKSLQHRVIESDQSYIDDVMKTARDVGSGGLLQAKPIEDDSSDLSDLSDYWCNWEFLQYLSGKLLASIEVVEHQ